MSACGKGAFLKQVVIFLVESTFFVALAPLAITSATILLTKNPFSWQLILLPFFACMLIYSLNRITDREEDAINTPGRIRFPHHLRIILLGVSFIFYVLLLFMVLQKNMLTFFIGIVPLVIALVYSVLRLKRVFILKNILIAGACSASVLIVPAYYDNWTGSWELLFPFFFVLVLLNTIVFDIKDVKGDSVFGIWTLPLRVGIPATKYFCFFLLAVAMIIFFPLFSFNRESVLLIPCLCTMAVYTYFAPEGEHYPWWYFGVLVDGEFLVLLLMVLIKTRIM
jgi:4-hydroxybenzoate polyprenyltransferase